MLCGRCQFENPAPARFCGRCGTALESVCPSCGSEVPPGFEYCGHCGAALAAGAGVAHAAEPAPAPPTATPEPVAPDPGEIRQVTVLGCQLVAEGGKSADAEVRHALLNRFLDLVQEEIGRFGGGVDQVLGGGVLALFGTPAALEDHAERAVLAAAALRRRMAEAAPEVQREHGARWAVRIGIDAGSVVASGERATAVGEAIDTARALLDRAGHGEILLGAGAARGVRSVFQLTDRPTEGGGDGRRAWLLEEAEPSLGRRRRFSGCRLSPFVGRRREMILIDELRREAAAGHGQVVGITGEPGSGKSRLLYELSRSFRGAPASSLRGGCLSYSKGIPYFPFLDMVRRASRITETDDSATLAAKLRTSLGALGLRLDESLPYFLRLLGLQNGTEALDGMEPHTLKNQTFHAMRQMVLAASRRGLVVMELEDLHWIDETSEEFLASLIEEMAGARLLLLLTYRSGYQPTWLQKSFATQITMRRLSSADSRAVAQSILGQGEEGALRTDSVVERAEGNPFFLEELSRALTEDTGGDEHQPRTPQTVQGVLMARIDHLPEPHKRLLQVGSLLDRELSLRLLQQLWDRAEPLPDLLADLQRWEFLYQAPSEEPAAYSFRHALTQEVAYKSLLKSRRKELHAQVAETLERLYADRLEDVYDRLIYHCPRAGDAERTVRYLVLFAERAASHYAHAEAAKALREALGHARRLPEAERDRRSIEVLLRLAESLLPLARLPETLEVCLAHQETLERVGDPALEARFHFWLAHTHTYLGHNESTREHAQLAIDAAQASGDQATEGKAWYVLGRNAFWAGDFAAGLEQSQRALVLLERSGEPWWQGQAYWVAGFHHWALGQFRLALQALRRCSDIGEALDDYRLDASWSLGFVEASLGEWETGIAHCQRGIERSRDPLNTAVATGFLGYAYLRKEEPETAIRMLQESRTLLAEAGMRQLLGWLTVFLAEAYLTAGRLEEGQEAAAEALEVCRDAQFEYGVGLARRALGRIAPAAADKAEARHQLEGALEIFQSLGAPFEVARTRLALAAAVGDGETARGELSEAHRLFRELDAAAYTREAEGLAAELGLEVASVRRP